LLQYLELLTSPDIISPEDYSKKIVPSLAELGELYGISAPICMQIIRPRLNESLLVSVVEGLCSSCANCALEECLRDAGARTKGQ
jgi:hypothetical protein